MERRYSVRQRLLGFGCALVMLILLAACSSSTVRSTLGHSAADGGTSAASGTATSPSGVPSGTAGDVETPPEILNPVEEYSPSSSTRYTYGEVRDSAGGTVSAPPTAPKDGKTLEGESPAPSEAPRPETPGAAPFILTAAEWNDNQNWPFFTNLVNAGTISFPSFGIDPRNRVVLTLTDTSGAPIVNEPVALMNADNKALWTARTDKSGTACLFFRSDETPDHVDAGGISTPVNVQTSDGSGQGTTEIARVDSLTVTGTMTTAPQDGLQVMFLVDTTGSMSDEIAYLQKDFSDIAKAVEGDGVSFSACFYRDEGDDYVTRMNPFTTDVSAVQSKINSEYADGGGDAPEAVAQALTEAFSAGQGWSETSAKVLFLIFDAPPHGGKEAELDAAIRSAAAQGIHVVPVVASNADRETELFGRAAAIVTNGTYVFLTDDSGVGGEHLEPIVGDYTVELLHDVIVRIIEGYKPD
ncbi:MAG: VWA domain-containing protein [Oscillospiraceae bacterium]|nr:VWA domain-containing protein [Oscillospiraceae bacterium]